MRPNPSENDANTLPMADMKKESTSDVYDYAAKLPNAMSLLDRSQDIIEGRPAPISASAVPYGRLSFFRPASGSSLMIMTTVIRTPARLTVIGAWYPRLSKRKPPIIGAGNAVTPRKAANFPLRLLLSAGGAIAMSMD